jgi:hypothetical protein
MTDGEMLSQKTVKFKDFVDFVKAETKKANDPTYGKSAMNYSQRDQKPHDMNHKLHRLISSCTCYLCDLFSNIHNDVLFPLNMQSCYLYSMQSYVYSWTNSSTHGDPINDRGKTMSKKYVPSNVCSSTSTLEGAGDMSCAMAIIPVRAYVTSFETSITMSFSL